MIYKNKSLRAFVVLLMSFSLVQAMKIEKESLFVPGRLGDIEISHDQNKFHVTHDGETSEVKSWQMDKELRGISQGKLAKLLAAGAYLQVNQSSSNDYTLKLQQRLVGGGPIGATIGACIGKGLVHAVGQVVLNGIALCTGPAYVPTLAALEATVVPLVIDPISNVAAVGCGILGAVATGPA